MYCITMAGILNFVQKKIKKNQQNPAQNFGSSHHASIVCDKKYGTSFWRVDDNKAN